jgi:hypothetical protein
VLALEQHWKREQGIIISDFDYYVLHWIKRTAAEFTVYGRELENV